MAQKIPNPNDLFIKATLNSPQAIQDFFEAYLPSQLRAYVDLASIQPAHASHVFPWLKELHNDFVFTCQIDQNLGFLILESQAKPDWRMPLRFVGYNAVLLDKYTKNKKPGTPWPFVLNFLFYHGPIGQLYPYPINCTDYLANPRLAQELAMSIPINLINISTLADTTLETHGTISLMEKLFKYRKEKILFEVIEHELERCRNWILGIDMDAPPLGPDYWETILYYASSFLNPKHYSEKDLLNLFQENLFKKREDIMRSIARQIEKRAETRGLQQGVQQGLQQGIRNRNIEVAKRMLSKGFETKLVQEVTGLNLEDLKKLGNNSSAGL